MPKKSKGGKKGKKFANKDSNDSKILVYKEEFQEYAVIDKVLGDGRYIVKCNNGEMRTAKNPRMFRRTRPFAGDLVLVSFRDCDSRNDKCDILHIYSKIDKRDLMNYGELDSKALQLEYNNDDYEDDIFEDETTLDDL